MEPTSNVQASSTVILTPSTTNGAAPPPLTRATAKAVQDAQGIIDINYIDEPQGLAGGAKKSRLNEHKLSEEEYEAFEDIAKTENIEVYNAYLYIRNRILEKWFDNVRVELTVQAALASLPQNYAQHKKLAYRVYHYLDRTGKINYGLIEDQFNHEPFITHEWLNIRPNKVPLQNLMPPPVDSRRNGNGRVIIIGAGLSGLTAARQLKRFGMDVIVLEARDRTGGRVHTYRKNNYIADLGPSCLHGVTGNPVVTIGKQLELLVMQLIQKFPIYEHKVPTKEGGVNPPCHILNSYEEDSIQREYDKLMESTKVISASYGIRAYQDRPLALGMAINWMIKLQEKNVKREQVRYLTTIEELYRKLIDNANKKLELARTIKDLHNGLHNILKETNESSNHKDKDIIDLFAKRCKARDLNIAVQKFEVLVDQEKEIEEKILELTKSPPSDIYLSNRDRRVLDWHFAELEYALGCPMNKLSMDYDDDEELFPGSLWLFVHGFNTITSAMSQDLDIRLNCAVESINISKDMCRVVTYDPRRINGERTHYTGDVVICTLPLGVLKETVKDQQYNQGPGRPKNIVEFSPPLPRWKADSISRLGSGNLNKVVLCFDKVFWNSNLHLFGTVSQAAKHRGEFFLFWHYTKAPVLTALISGDAADNIEDLSDQAIVDKCLSLLRGIFGKIPQHDDCIITRWRKDHWSRGAWSYLEAGSSGDDFDTLALPITYTDEEMEHAQQLKLKCQQGPLTIDQEKPEPDIVGLGMEGKNQPRLFFAGEHTLRNHSATAHGAIMSGLREACRVANIYLGCPYLEIVPDGVFSEVDDDDGVEEEDESSDHKGINPFEKRCK